MCLARYKTRPGLTYHYNHSHKDRGDTTSDYHLPDHEDPEHRSVDSPSAGSDSLDGSMSSRGHGHHPGVSGHDDRSMSGGRRSFSPPKLTVGVGITMPGSKKSSGRSQSSGYCDFCLGDASNNKKTNQPEELIACSECGRSGGCNEYYILIIEISLLQVTPPASSSPRT